MAIVNTTDEIDRTWGHCFNCVKEGHHWHDCMDPLKESLKQVKEQLNCKNKANLNINGHAGMKGGQPSKAYMAKAKN